eukprot:gene12259-26110_t
MFTLYTATVLLATTRCNPEEYEAKHAVSNTFVGAAEPYTSVPLTLIGGKDAGDEAPACLDGSPYGFYFQPSAKKSTKWTISINGGGWCYDEVDCFCRSKTNLGTSTVLPTTGSCA